MKTFEQLFPDFVNSCDQLHTALLPMGLVLLVFSFAFLFWQGPPQPIELVRHLVKLFLIMLLITHTERLINWGQEGMERFVTLHVPARPENVAERFKEKLSEAQNSSAIHSQSGWEMLFSANFFEAIIYSVLVLVSWLAIALQFYIDLLRHVLLLLCWVLAPVLFGCFAVPPVSGLALRHLLRIIGLLTWPLGLALAATITDGLLGLQTDQGIWNNGAAGKVQYVLINLLAIATIALWILFSSVLAPAVMQRLFTGTSGGASLVSHAATLLVQSALPMFTGVASTVVRRSVAAARSTNDDRPPPPLIHLEPLPSNPVEPPELGPLHADETDLDDDHRLTKPDHESDS